MEEIIKIKPGDTIEGIFRGSRGGFGFIEAGGEDLFVPPAETGGAMDGDRVSAVVHIDKRSIGDKLCGNVTAVLERAVFEYTGTVGYIPVPGRRARKILSVIPDNTKLSLRQLIDDGGIRVTEGDKVLVLIDEYPDGEGSDGVGVIKENLGPADSKDANYRAILLENGIETEFDPAVIAEAEKSASRPLSAEGRVDLRDKIIFTIDGAGAKDLDDAISLEKTDGGYLLGVHIADVSEYVKWKSKTDECALKRGTSVYFTDKVVPMLPESLSNGSCSLNAGTDKYAMSAFISLDESGGITGCEIKESIIRSCMRGVYEEMNDILALGEESEYYGKYSFLFSDTVPLMLELYKILESNSAKRGTPDMETPEPEIILNSGGWPVEIKNRERGTFERLIEQFMICANTAVAEFMRKKGLPCVNRVHETPDPEKMREFAQTVSLMGISTRGLKPENADGRVLSEILAEADKYGLKKVVSYLMLRSMAKAKYSSSESGHYGLALSDYCHFTSPIRRYPDLTVHRILKMYLRGELNKSATMQAMKKFAAKSADKSSENELKAITAERAIEDMYMVLYMKDRIGKQYDAVITTVNGFGFFAELENSCEGLVTVESLDGRFAYDERSATLSSGKVIFRLGGRLRIEVADTDIASGRIYFTVPGCTAKPARPAGMKKLPGTGPGKKKREKPGREKKGKSGKKKKRKR